MIAKKETYEVGGKKWPVYPYYDEFAKYEEFYESDFHRELLERVYAGADMEKTITEYLGKYLKCRTRFNVGEMIDRGIKYVLFEHYGVFTMEQLIDHDFELAFQMKLYDFEGFINHGNMAEPKHLD